MIGLPDAEAGEVPTALVVKQRNVDAKELQNFVSGKQFILFANTFLKILIL